MEEVKRIPYGVSNFVEVVEQNQYYVDKTMYLPLLEKQPSNLFFIRPRRFGKSIFLSMLRTYYDIAQKEKFEKRFSNLWIGSRPTQLQGTFQILFLDFSRVGGLDRTLAENFDDYCCGGLDDFASIYEPYYYPGFEEEMKAQYGTTNKLNFLDRKARNNGSKLYLIVDEYDNFTNVVLNEQGDKVYHALTHASGFYREIFKKFKGMFERIFMTGVSPVTLDDLTSGFNIGWNISTDHQFNMMLGFSETDVREMIQYYKDAGQLPGNTNIDAMIEEMRPWYDNYCFAEESLERDPKMFNCDMVFYYLRHYMTLGKSPKEMIDPNTRTDYNKMKKLIRLDKLDGNRKGVLRKITEDGAAAKEGYTFKGWYTDSAFKNKITKVKKGTRKNYKLYAKWKINTYNIVFDGNGATSGSMKSISSCKYNTSYKLSANTFQRNGYKFIGWSTKADGSDTFYGDGATVSNLSITNGATVKLYAQWEAL